MSKYRIALEGKIYELEIEMVEDQNSLQNQNLGSYTAYHKNSLDTSVRVINPSLEIKTSNDSNKVIAPMPGAIIKILKNSGECVHKGETVLILEAMKMENEITAPKGGVIAAMNASEGGMVATGELLFEVQ